MNKFFSSLVAVFAGIVFFSTSNALAAAFGVSPPWIENDNLKAGSNFVYVINMSASDLPKDMAVSAELEGDPEIMQWLTIRDKDNLIIPRGQNIVPISVDMNIPEDAKVGKYNGNMKLNLVSDGKETDNIAILLGSNVSIALNVVDYDVTDYWIKEIKTDTTPEGGIVKLDINLKNTGNTVIDSIMANISVIDAKTGETLISGSSDKLNRPVYPQMMENAELSFPAVDLKEGTYFLEVELLKNGEPSYKSRLFLTVGPSIVNSSVSTSVNVTEENLAPAAENGSNDVIVQTSVRVRAPITDSLIAIVIGILIILTIIVAKVYGKSKKRRR